MQHLYATQPLHKNYLQQQFCVAQLSIQQCSIFSLPWKSSSLVTGSITKQTITNLRSHFIKVTVKPNSYMALNRMCEIWGSSGSIVEDSSLPACDAVLLHEWSLTFWRTAVLLTCLRPLTLWHSITSQMTWICYWKSATKLVWWNKLSINEWCCRVICLQAIALLR
jgi:hypothetical protein